MRAIGRSLAELRSTDAKEEETASFEFAASARRFSRDTKASVDDKLSFSATLMRAGEVHAATRLVAELEEDVREEEVALVEAINEVQVARSLRRERITRLRLARLLVASMLGACLMGASVMAIGVAGMFADLDTPTPARVAAPPDGSRSDRYRDDAIARGKTVKHVRIGGTLVALNKEQLSDLRDLKKGTLDPASLEAFLASLPLDVVDSVRLIIESAAVPVGEAVIEAVELVPAAASGPKGSDAGSTPSKDQKKTDEDPTDVNEPPAETDTGGTDTGGTLNDTKHLPL